MITLQAQAIHRASSMRDCGVCAPFCATCKTEVAVKTCVVCDAPTCADHGRACAGCGATYCERDAIKALTADDHCENCQFKRKTVTCADCSRTHLAIDTVLDGKDILCVGCCGKRFRDEDSVRGFAA